MRLCVPGKSNGMVARIKERKSVGGWRDVGIRCGREAAVKGFRVPGTTSFIPGGIVVPERESWVEVLARGNGK